MNVHTPLYNTNLNKHTSDPNAPSSWSTVPVEQQQYGMLKQFEAAFFKKYSVNFVFAGHVHTYERFQAMYNGTAADATGTVFMSVGTGGSVGDFGGYPPYTDAKGVRWTQNGKVWIASNCLLTKTLTLTIMSITQRHESKRRLYRRRKKRPQQYPPHHPQNSFLYQM